jgi:hypothetical protein
VEPGLAWNSDPLASASQVPGLQAWPAVPCGLALVGGWVEVTEPEMDFRWGQLQNSAAS